ncbi:hypothetical protein ACJVC5_16885 [Peredibacter sp. HCB2-198]|uniref:hypothetical protein n=1 Tax=Peredibacter sp. HCB2-198 TaxID=3383025 RepID=UPI0038B47551
MNFDKKKLESELPSFFPALLDELYLHGHVPTLVGGAVRDFFLFGSTGKDWDIELSHETIAFNKDQWKQLAKDLSRFGKVTSLPYEIIRLEAEGFQLEFSPPRKEHFEEDKNHHSNFTAEFIFKLPFEEAVQRRDFTINAMGFRFKTKKDIEHLDPLEGLRHLREKVLHFAGPDFGKDPVRFLRAHRFAEKYQFQFSPELKKVLDQMRVDGFTPNYLWTEMQKSLHQVGFLGRILKEKERHPEMRLPLDPSVLPKLDEVKKVLSDPKRHEAWIVALEWTDIPYESWREYFSVGSDSARRLARWAQSSKSFQKILPETFHGEFEEIRDTENFEKLFDWYFTTKQLLQKNPDLPLMKMIEDYLPDWIHLYRFEAVKDVKHIDPPFRAKYQVWNLCQRL